MYCRVPVMAHPVETIYSTVLYYTIYTYIHTYMYIRHTAVGFEACDVLRVDVKRDGDATRRDVVGKGIVGKVVKVVVVVVRSVETRERRHGV